jgi:alkylresorcinol/alkylpyrone synthase
VTARIRSIGTAVPPAVDQQELWDDHFADRYGGMRGARRIWESAGVSSRHAVIDPRRDDVSDWSTGARMERYTAEATPLARLAVERALVGAELSPEAVDLLTVVSCTGYATPGLDLTLARDLGMPSALQRLVVGHMGCYAALPGVASVADAVAARGLTAVLLSAELPSLHVQPSSRDVGQLVAHALFSDAAVAMVLSPSAPGLRVVDLAVRTDASHHDDMTWHITDLGFRMGLSPRVPAVLGRHARPVVEELLGRHRLGLDDVRGWAIHPGGPRILDVCADVLELGDAAMAPSRDTLRQHGNCSSATVLLVLDRLLGTRSLGDGDHVLAMAFGPGLTLYAALLRMETAAR